MRRGIKKKSQKRKSGPTYRSFAPKESTKGPKSYAVIERDFVAHKQGGYAKYLALTDKQIKYLHLNGAEKMIARLNKTTTCG